MSKKIFIPFLILTLLFLFACKPQEFSEKIFPSSEIPSEPYPLEKSSEPSTEQYGLDALCSGEQNCKEFCQNNQEICEKYCRGKYENEFCKKYFLSPQEEVLPEKDASEHQNLKTCSGTGTVVFTSPPMYLEDIETIQPIGLMIGGHVTPIDHGYYAASSWKAGSKREDPSQFRNVLAPAAGLIEIQSMPQEYASSSLGDYRLIIHHTCSFYTIYIHVNQLSEKLQQAFKEKEIVAVEAGEVLGKAPGFDFSVHNEEVTLDGFIIPEHYEIEPFKIHTVDMFAHFAEPIKSQLLKKNVRQEEPRGGKIDYDIDGKLVGNWFEIGTNGYEGKKEYQRLLGYWSTHLAFAYDGLVPSTLVVSIGDFAGEAKQFGVVGNAPDPSKVDLSSGLVKYELISYEYLTDMGTFWDRQHFAKVTATQPSSSVTGVVLVQLLEPRKIKFEAFPGKTASQIESFTEKAKAYER
ncbi:hypothetical protein HYX13_03660 [Candidatus Woesearchaeota archaeon]|nr:hypothetical protein [Candidatus Woesearchaeota archaeon]